MFNLKFIFYANIQRLRQYGWRINEINTERCNIRLGNHVSRTENKGYRKVVDALVAGGTSSDALIKLIHGRTVNRCGKSAVHDILEGCIAQSDRDMLGQYTQMFDMYDVVLRTRVRSKACKLSAPRCRFRNAS